MALGRLCIRGGAKSGRGSAGIHSSADLQHNYTTPDYPRHNSDSCGTVCPQSVTRNLMYVHRDISAKSPRFMKCQSDWLVNL